MNQVLNEAKRLHHLGAAVHWLRPKSKVPLEPGWTTGPRKPWPKLQSTYAEGLNVGVLLGEASKIGDNYLCCIDVDVKNPAFKKDALAKLFEITGGREMPTVLSGSGNGSRHLYCVTRAPFKMKTVAKVADAWEICIYSSGRQMVLPPSTHPDTGKTYSWFKEIESESSLPLMNFDSIESVSVKRENKKTKPVSVSDDVFTFEVQDIHLDDVKVSDKMKAAILKGEGVLDRSGYLLPACAALVRSGLKRDEVLTVLTEPDTFLGACSYDHAKTSDRARAAYWLWRYTLSRVMAEQSAKNVFASVPIEGRALNDEEQAEQSEEFSLESGFYKLGPRGSSVPDYDALLSHFVSSMPYKSIGDSKSIYAFNGQCYESFSMLKVKAFAEENFCPKPTEKMRCEFFSKVVSNNLSSRSFFARPPENKINFKNGVLDLSSWDLALLPHSPDYSFSYVLPYDFDPDASCPFFRKWIDSVMLGDKQLIAILQEFMGYIVRGGEYTHHKALWLEGIGRNGKSTFIDVLKALVGHENYSTISIKALVGDRFAGASLEGKIANFSEETSPSELRDSGPFKNLTGDGEISAQRKFEGPFYFRNRAKLIMTYNTIPNLSDLSPGMLSRPIIVPFRKTIRDHEQDKNIKAKLTAELPGIFNFALEGWERLEAQNGFTESPHSSLALTKVKEESCNVFQWVELYVDFLAEDAGTLTPSREIYSAYKRAERFAYASSEFFRRLRNHPKMQERYTRTNGKSGYKSVKILG